MPTLHPAVPHIPPSMHAEREVLRALRTLPPECHVFARMSILDPKTNLDRELDFLVVHPELGLVIIEVKGRGVEPRGDHWIRKSDRGGVETLDETPGEQLLAQQYALLNFLKTIGLSFVPQVTRVLAVPSLPLEDGEGLGPDLPACRVLTRRSLTRCFLALREAVSGGEDWDAWKRTPLGKHHQVRPDVLSTLLSALVPRLLPPPPLSQLLAEEGRLQDEAAQGLLDHLATNFTEGRFSVSGGPGSGKSLLARQTAQLWAAGGRRVLVVAFNRALTYATQCALEDLVSTGQATVATFHDLAATLLDQVGQKPAYEDGESFFNRDLPAALAALVAGPSRPWETWDALVVDEAQDLDQAWVASLQGLLRSPGSDPVLLLQDPAQGLFRQGCHTVGQPWRIDLSLRQHPALRREAWLAFPQCGWTAPEPGPDEGVVTRVSSSTRTWRQDLEDQLARLAGDGLQPGQVLILSPRRPHSLGVADGSRLGPWTVNAITDWWEAEKEGHVRMGTVHAFKGLEADVVIYLAPAQAGPDSGRLAYTAYSRARHRLVILERAIPGREAARAKPQEAPKGKQAPPAPRVPEIRTFSAAHRTALLGALKAASEKSRRGA